MASAHWSSGQMVNIECWEGNASGQVQDGLHSPCLCVGCSGAGLADGHALVQNNLVVTGL